MRVLIALPGLHRVSRGAEVAFESIAQELSVLGHDVTVFGSGPSIEQRAYHYEQLRLVARERFERWPTFPPIRDVTTYEGITFAVSTLARFRPGDFDITMTCGFPAENLALRRWARHKNRPVHIFVTENGDWPAFNRSGEYRLFSCDGLVCTNPQYLERNQDRWNCTLIPNGVNLGVYSPGAARRAALGLPTDRPIIVMVSALIPSKRVLEGIRAAAHIDDAFVLVAGDGPLRAEVNALGDQLLPGRFLQTTFQPSDMPDVYRSADVLLHTTYVESFGNIYIEAMATGLPVVAHRSVVTEWILESNGQLVDTDDQGAIVQALAAQLARGRANLEPMIEMVARRFSWTTIAQQYAEFMQLTRETARR